jgi:hypothetical protein
MSETTQTERDSATEGTRRHRAGLFDIRTIIGLLLGIYGVILVVAAFFTPDDQISRSDGVNVNLWAGLGMVVVGAAFVLWARLRPTVVPEDPAGLEEEAPAAHDRSEAAVDSPT